MKVRLGSLVEEEEEEGVRCKSSVGVVELF